MLTWVKTLFVGSKWIGIAGIVLAAGLTLFVTIQYIQNVGELKSQIEYQQEQIDELEKNKEIRKEIDGVVGRPATKEKAPREKQEALDYLKDR